MRKILIPTDFSENANAAIEYACYLANDIEAEVILLNVYIVESSRSGVMANLSEIMNEDSKRDLEKSIAEIRKNPDLNNLSVSSMSSYGYLTENLESITERDNEIELVVMGTTGAGSIGNKLFGSNTMAAFKRVKIPVLAIPQKAKYQYWKNIAFATNVENQENDIHFEPLCKLIDLKQTHLTIISINKDETSIDKDAVYKRIHPKIGTSFDLEIIKSEKIADGILDYLENNETDVMVLIRKDYSFFENLFHSSVTRKLALHAKIPMLLYKG